MSTKHLWLGSFLAGCTANAASSEPSPRPHACAPASPDDIEPHDVLRIASADGSTDLVVHAWTNRDGAIVDVHTVWQPSIYAGDVLPLFPIRPAVRVDTDPWRVSIGEGVRRWEIDVALGEDDDVLAFATVVTGDEEPTWCRLRSARSGKGRIEARCEDASGTDVEGWIAATSG